jgi:hypothetical protein
MQDLEKPTGKGKLNKKKQPTGFCQLAVKEENR